GGATVPPWLPAKSARVSNLPACCALGPPACAAPYSCHHEACSARSAWPHPGKACPSAWIEHRSGERQGAPARAQSVRALAQEVLCSFLLTHPPSLRRLAMSPASTEEWRYLPRR